MTNMITTICELPKTTKLVNRAIEFFDIQKQDLILIEEMSELTKALLKHRRNKCMINSIKEEISHVLISIEVVCQILEISKFDIEKEAEKKLKKYGWID